MLEARYNLEIEWKPFSKPENYGAWIRRLASELSIDVPKSKEEIGMLIDLGESMLPEGRTLSRKRPSSSTPWLETGSDAKRRVFLKDELPERKLVDGLYFSDDGKFVYNEDADMWVEVNPENVSYSRRDILEFAGFSDEKILHILIQERRSCDPKLVEARMSQLHEESERILIEKELVLLFENLLID